MHRGRRPPVLITLYAVGVYALGLLTLAGLVGWGWPVIDAAGMAAAVTILALWATLWAGRAAAGPRRRGPRRDRADE